MISPFASQLYQMPSDLKQQLELADSGRTSGSRRQSLLLVSAPPNLLNVSTNNVQHAVLN